MLQQFEITAEKSFIGGWFIDPDLCDRLIGHFEGCDQKGPGRTGNGVDKRVKDSTEVNMDISVSIVKEYVVQLQLVTTQYINMYPECARTYRWEVESANIQKYDPGGGFYLWHTERTSLDPHVVGRHLVFMTYLNDVTDAGETEFYYQKTKIKPQKGLTLIWPVDWTHTHRGIPSPTQTKYIVTGWFVFIE